VKVGHGRGDRIDVSIDGANIVTIAPLFETVSPDDCAWTMEDGEVVITMVKPDVRPWATLRLDAQ